MMVRNSLLWSVCLAAGFVAVGCRSTSPAVPGDAALALAGPFEGDLSPVHVGPITWQFVAVSEDQTHKSWAPDGAPLNEWVASRLIKGVEGDQKPMAVVTEADRWLTFVVRVDGVPFGEQPSIAFRFDHDASGPSGFTSLEGIDDVALKDGKLDTSSEYWLAGTRALTKSKKVVDIEVGVAFGRWQTASAYAQKDGKFVLSEGSEFPMFALQETVPDTTKPSRESSFSVSVQLPSNIGRHAYRLIALDREGKEITSAGSMAKNDEALPSEYWFRGRLSDVGAIKLQIRDYEWTTFKNVQLQPMAQGRKL